jgi:uncharacterized membrane protein
MTARRPHLRAHADLLLALACSVGAVLVVLGAPDLAALRVVLGIPLVLAVPGYGLAVALFGERRPDGPSLVVWAISLSIAVTILAALVLDALGVALTAQALTLTLAAIGGGAALAGWARRPSGTRRSVPAGAAALLRSPWFAGTLAAAAVFALLLGALGEPATNPGVPGYTQLAAQREPGAGVRVAIQSAEQRTTRYRVRVRTPLRVLARRTISLRPGERWTRVIGRPAQLRASTVGVSLYRVGAHDPRGPYRRLQLRP